MCPPPIIQIVTGVEVTIGNCFASVGEILPFTETDNACFVIPHSSTKKYKFVNNSMPLINIMQH